MKKRILSLLLAAVMLIGLLPTVALADEPETDTPTIDSRSIVVHEEKDDPIHIVKSVSGDTLTLEAYVTNPLKIVTDTVPLDIALVLDVSGSMEDKIWYQKYTPVYNVNPNSRDNYYYQNADGYYERAYYCDGWVHYWFFGEQLDYKEHEAGWFADLHRHGNGHDTSRPLTPKTSESDADTTHTQFYTAQRDKVKKIDVLKEAVNAFINNVHATSPNSQIALVKFAGDVKEETGNNKYNYEGNTYNYSQIVKPLTKADENGAGALKGAVSKLSPAGATRTDNGMKRAAAALKGANNQKVVIVFTDGKPTTYTEYDSNVAASAVEESKKLKKDNTLVYTIAVPFNENNTGADRVDPSDTTSNINKFLHAVSSNYPQATATESSITPGDRAANSNYYRVATTGGELTDIFTQISKEVSSLTLSMGTSTVLSDTLSQYFTFKNPAGTDGTYGIKVYTAEAKTDQTELEWKDAVEFTEADLKVGTDKSITVKNFNYGAEAVTIGADGKITSGKKLIIKIPITPDTAYENWNKGEDYYPTNSTKEGEEAGLSGYTDEKNNKLSTKLDKSPEAPVTAYDVTYSSTVTLSTETKPVADPTDSRHYIPGQTVTVANAPSADGWTFAGWTAPEGVTVTTGENGKKTFTMGNANVELTGTWTKNPTKANVTITKTFTGEGFQQTMVPNNFGLTLNKVEDAGEGEEQKKTPQTLTKGEGYTWTATLGAGNYEITESNADVDGWTRTTTGLTFSVTEDDIKNGTKSVTVTNTYTKYTSAEVDLSALIKKTLEGGDKMPAGASKTFTVKLTPVQQSGTTYVPIEGGTAITGTADCSTSTTDIGFTFSSLTDNKLTFSGEQTVYYKVEEDFPTGAGSVPGMTYDASKYILTIAVTKDETENQYTATSTITDEGGTTHESITFTNKYEPITFNLSGKIKKTMEFGAEGATDVEKKNSEDAFKQLPAAQKTFTVKLTRGSVGETGYWHDYTDSQKRVYTATATLTEAGTVSFSNFTDENGYALTDKDGKELLPLINFTWSDTGSTWTSYETYRVEEVIPDVSRPGMTYDTAQYVLAITYMPSNEKADRNGLPYAFYPFDKNSGTFGSDKAFTEEGYCVFTNKYVQPSSSATKTVLTRKPNTTAITLPDNVSYPTNDTVVVDRTVNEVTLAYAVAVTGTQGKTVGVYDKGATYVGYEVTNGNESDVYVTSVGVGDGMMIRFTGNATVTLYYTKTFTRDAETGTFPTATNTAVVNGTNVPSDPTEIKDKEPGGFDFSDIILKDLYVTGDQNFPSSLTFRAELKFEGFKVPEPEVSIQSLDPTEKSATDEVVEAFGKNWFEILTATFYPEDVTFDAHNTTNFLSDGSHLYLTFPAEGHYAFTLKEIDDKQDGVKYDGTEYTIYVTVEDDNNGGLKVTRVYCTYMKDDEHCEKVLYTSSYHDVITFFNEADTGDIPYYPIIPILPTVKDEGKLNKTDHFAYIIGYPDGTVHPNGEITRAEVATIFFRLLKDDVRNAYFTSYNNYSDVSYGKWYNNPISTMSALGIINGYPDGTFRPDAPITRAEFAAIAARFDETATRGTTTFTDVYGHWAADEIAKAYGNDWIKGYPDGTFRPDRNITRAEAMALINRVLDRRPESPSDLLPDMNKWSDNMDTSKWYYLDIQEATNSHDYTRKTFGYEMWKRMLDDPDWSRYER